LEAQTTLPQFKEILREHFQLNRNDIKLRDIKRGAEITSVLSFKEENDYEIIAEESKVNGIVEDNPQTNPSNKVNNSVEIKFDDLLTKKFNEDDLDIQMNKWANPKGFNLIFGEGRQELNNEIKSTLICNVKGYYYQIIFKGNKDGSNFEVYEKLSVKYRNHSNLRIYFSDLLIKGLL